MFLLPLSETETLAEAARKKEQQIEAKSQVAVIQVTEHTIEVEHDTNVVDVVQTTGGPKEANEQLEKQRKKKADKLEHQHMEADDSSSLTEHNQEVGEVNTKETLVQNEVDSLLEEEGKAGKRDNSKEEAGDVTKQSKENTVKYR